ncbi:GAF domain-containing protein [Halopolyspora algeriensis]|uniref:GAF domain-containing protein n=1 Tax=Halopolyspora algeriensis TaxID=1500506 RepID=A0A368VVE8_9ACTN|nr:GAF domain-containing protein [Halopolyspora algeriensis]RCW44628.1 GAF domain-containing protein [Halopolyspora algeriensis]TQM55989.1 GAF domain-containing protein [Halopolyspora algeriensis]
MTAAKTRFRKRQERAGEDVTSVLHALAEVLTCESRNEDNVCDMLGSAVAVLQNADMGSVVTVAATGHAEPAADTDERAHAVDLAQYRAGGGPWLEVARTGTVAQAAITEVRTHWPGFVRSARESRLRSFLSAPLIGEDRVRAVLNLYSHSPLLGDFDAGRLRPFGAAPKRRGHPCGGARHSHRRDDHREAP